MQHRSDLFDSELVTLARETRRVADSIDNAEIRARLLAIAEEVLKLAYHGDKSNVDEFAAALARLDLNADDCRTP